MEREREGGGKTEGEGKGKEEEEGEAEGDSLRNVHSLTKQMNPVIQKSTPSKSAILPNHRKIDNYINI